MLTQKITHTDTYTNNYKIYYTKQKCKREIHIMYGYTIRHDVESQFLKSQLTHHYKVLY